LKNAEPLIVAIKARTKDISEVFKGELNFASTQVFELGGRTINQAFIQDKGDCKLESYELFKNVSGKLVTLSVDNKESIVSKYTSAPDKTSITVKSEYETFKEIVVRLTTTDGQSRDMILSITVCGTEQIFTRLPNRKISKFVLSTGTNDGKLEMDLTKATTGYVPFFGFKSRIPQCGLNTFQLFRADQNDIPMFAPDVQISGSRNITIDTR